MGQQGFNTKTETYAQRRASSQGRVQKPLPGRAVYRRRRKKVSLWKHLFGALTVILGAIVALVIYVDLFGDAGDAIPKQRVDLAPLPQAPAFDSLNGTGDTLPDLLGDVAEGENPTEKIDNELKRDALGNPIGTRAATDTMAGPASSNAATASTPLGDITINGQAIGGGLIPAPVSGLSKSTPYGPIPTRGADGRTAFKVYARPYTAVSNAKPVSLVIGGLGINRTLTERAINELPADVTLSFAAHAPNLQSQINAARKRGHEVLLEIPMESAEFNATEPGAEWALRVGSEASVQNKRNLDRLLSRASGYFAVTNFNGDLFLQRSDQVVPMMASLSDAGVGFVFDGSVNAPSLPTLANASRLPFLKAFALIDTTPDNASITAELERMSKLAQGGTAPVGVGFSYPQTIDAVINWVNTLEARGLTLAPVSSRVPVQ